MANRQHGRSRSHAGGRSPAGGQSPAGGRNAGAIWTVPRPQPGVPSYREPEVRRWPHPVGEVDPAPAPEPALHYIRCALSYQNQLLADIKTLLEQMAGDTSQSSGEAAKETKESV